MGPNYRYGGTPSRSHALVPYQFAQFLISKDQSRCLFHLGAGVSDLGGELVHHLQQQSVTGHEFLGAEVIWPFVIQPLSLRMLSFGPFQERVPSQLLLSSSTFPFLSLQSSSSDPQSKPSVCFSFHASSSSSGWSCLYGWSWICLTSSSSCALTPTKQKG